MSPYEAYLRQLGVVSLWMMDDPATKGVTDSVGGNTATLTSGTAANVASSQVIGETTAADLDGSTYFNKSSPTGLTLSGAWSFGLWVKWQTLDGGWPIVISTNATTDYIGVQRRGGFVSTRAEVSDTNVGYRTDTTAVAGTWYHLVLTRSSGGTINQYLNGVSNKTTTEGSANVGDATMFTVGARDSGGISTFDGEAQGAFFSTNEFAAAQVKTLYSRSLAAPSPIFYKTLLAGAA
jgi:hypothetical protein